MAWDLSKPKKRKQRDWRKKADYEDMKKYSYDRLAFEFLRRNSGYRKDPKPERWGLRKCGPGPKYYYDPDKEYPNAVFGFSYVLSNSAGEIKGTQIDLTKNEVMYNPELARGKVSIIFSLYDPIKPQLVIANKILHSLQNANPNKQKIKKSFKPRFAEKKADLVELLRILDAYAAGIKPAEIAQCLYPLKKEQSEKYFPEKVKEKIRAMSATITDRKRQADKYVKKDYRLLALLPNRIPRAAVNKGKTP